MCIPASDKGLDDVQPDTNHSSSVVTARRKTRFVVRSGRIGIRESESEGESGLGFEREKAVEQRWKEYQCPYDRGDVRLPRGCAERD